MWDVILKVSYWHNFPVGVRGSYMKWASGISENSNLGDALNECISEILEQMDATNPDLAMVFVSSHYQQDIPNLLGVHPHQII